MRIISGIDFQKYVAKALFRSCSDDASTTSYSTALKAIQMAA